MSTSSSDKLSDEDSKIKIQSGSENSLEHSSFDNSEDNDNEHDEDNEYHPVIRKQTPLRHIKSAKLRKNSSRIDSQSNKMYLSIDNDALSNLSSFLSVSQEDLNDTSHEEIGQDHNENVDDDDESSIKNEDETKKQKLSLIREDISEKKASDENKIENKLSEEKSNGLINEQNEVLLEQEAPMIEPLKTEEISNFNEKESDKDKSTATIEEIITKSLVMKNEEYQKSKTSLKKVSKETLKEEIVKIEPHDTLGNDKTKVENQRSPNLSFRQLSFQGLPTQNIVKLTRFNTTHEFILPTDKALSEYESDESSHSEYSYYSNSSSDYGLEDLFFEFEIIDKETRTAVESLLDKMLKTVNRKIYLYEAQVLKKTSNDNEEIKYFTKYDNLIDIDREIEKIEIKKNKPVKIKETKLFAEEEEDEESEEDSDEDEEITTSSEISMSSTDEYFSFLQENLEKEQNLQLEKKEPIYISSEENSYANLEEKSRFIKEEMKHINIARAQLRLLDKTKIETHNKLILKKSSIPTNHVNLFHDDFFLTETPVVPSLKNEQLKEKTKINLKPQIKSQDSKRLNLDKDKSTKREKPNVRISKKKDPLETRRDAKIAELEKIFKDPKRDKSGRRITDINKSRPQTAVTRPKSAIKIKYVPETVDIKTQIKLPKLPPSSSQISKIPSASSKRSILPIRAKSAICPIDDRQKYPRPTSSKQPWGTIVHPPYGLGYQKMTPYEIKQSVERLYSASKDKQKKNVKMRPISCLPESDYINMLDRLTQGSSDKPPDRCRTQNASIYRNLGVLNSYAWKGYSTLPRF